MYFYINNRVNNEEHIIEKENETEARNWVINHLDTSIEWFIGEANENLNGAKDWEEDDEEFEQFDDSYDRDFNDNYSSSERMWADRSDAANEAYNRGEIDEEQRAERRMGA